jgi:hypothetical protein
VVDEACEGTHEVPVCIVEHECILAGTADPDQDRPTSARRGRHAAPLADE